MDITEQDLQCLIENLCEEFVGFQADNFNVYESHVSFSIQISGVSLEVQIFPQKDGESFSALLFGVFFLNEKEEFFRLAEPFDIERFQSLEKSRLLLRYCSLIMMANDDGSTLPSLQRVELLDASISLEDQNFNRLASSLELCMNESSNFFVALIATPEQNELIQGEKFPDQSYYLH